MKPTDLTGQRFGRLVAQAIQAHRQPNGKSVRKWACLCDCGNVTVVHAVSLRIGQTQSCGCLQREAASARFKKHGQSNSRLYRIYANMLYRCFNRNCKAYHNYGGRGITVCDEWVADFEAFARDVGNPPSTAHSLDRIDNDLGYHPRNVRWSTNVEQCRNRRGLRMVDYKGTRVCLAELAEITGLQKKLLWSRIVVHGWPVELAAALKPKVGQKIIGNLGNQE